MVRLSLCAATLTLALVGDAFAQSGTGGRSTIDQALLATHRGVQLHRLTSPVHVKTELTTSLPATAEGCTNYYHVAFAFNDDLLRRFLNIGLTRLSEELSARVRLQAILPSVTDAQLVLRLKAAAKDEADFEHTLLKRLVVNYDPKYHEQFWRAYVGGLVSSDGTPVVGATFKIDRPSRARSDSNVIQALWGTETGMECLFTGEGQYILFLDAPTFTHVITLDLLPRCGSQVRLSRNFELSTPPSPNIQIWIQGLSRRIVEDYNGELAHVKNLPLSAELRRRFELGTEPIRETTLATRCAGVSTQ